MSAIETAISKVEVWRHRIPLPDGSVTPGKVNSQRKLSRIGLPADLTGKTVLDIGCSDGFFSFECEKRGASRVLAVDNFSDVDVDSGSGFFVAKDILGSSVEYIESDFFQLDSRGIGQFDLVLFLGVLYHLRHPLLGFDKLTELCKSQLIVETAVIKEGLGTRVLRNVMPWQKATTVMEFFEYDDLNKDPTNWWRPSTDCVEAMLRSSGFCNVTPLQRFGSRAVFHAFSPRFGTDVEEFVNLFGSVEIAETLKVGLGTDVRPADVERFLKDLPVPRFALVRQQVFEVRAKERRRS